MQDTESQLAEPAVPSPSVADLHAEYAAGIADNGFGSPPRTAPPAPDLPRLQSLLAEWDTRFQEGQTRLDDYIERDEERQHRADLDAMVQAVRKNDSFSECPAEMIEALLHGHAACNPEFNEAWNSRRENPAVFSMQLNRAAASIAKWLEALPANRMRTDIEAAHGSVRAQSLNPPPYDDGFDPKKGLDYSHSEWEAIKERARNAPRR